MNIAWIIGNILAFGGLVAAIYYLLAARGPVVISSSFDPVVARGVERIRKRRKFGAALMAAVAFLFIIALNGFLNVRTPSMIIFWLLLLVLLLWLLVIAGLDLLAIGRLRRQLDHQSGDQISKLFKNTPFPTKVKHENRNKD